MTTRPQCDLFIRSYARDFGWLRYCLRSIDRFCRGFRRTVVAIPEADHEWFVRTGLPLTDVVLCPRFHDDYLGQQCTKLHADLLTDADWIFHMDSDCVVAQPFRPDDLIQAGRGRQFVTRHRDLPERHPWKSCTSRFLGIDPGYDFMRRFPIPYPRWLYSQVREFCQHRHGVSLETYVTRQPPRGFSEFNALGGYAYLHYPNAFEWVDEGGETTTNPCRTYWSWGGLTETVVEEIECLLSL